MFLGLITMVIATIATAAFAQNRVVQAAGSGTTTVFISDSARVYVTDSDSVPVRVWWTSQIVDVSGGQRHFVLVRANGVVQTFASAVAFNNQYGELGIASTSGEIRVENVNIPGSPRITTVAAGGFFSMALSDSGVVYAWGRNNKGQLGDGSTLDRHQPQPVIGLENLRIVAIAAGQAHALALTDTGQVYAWGDNARGQLGRHDYEGFSAEPRVVWDANLNPIGFVTAIASSSSANHSLAIINGRVVSWGANGYAQLGTGTNANTAWGVLVPGLRNVKQVAAAATASYALTESGNLYAWSNNEYGQIGDGSGRHQPGPTQVDSLKSIAFIAAAEYYAHAIGTDGRVWGWGRNDSSQLGTGDQLHRAKPTLIRGFWVTSEQ
jgi:alpha-tubulin suppressor-like RCC1 family protein